MARNYVLGPHAARELKRLIRGNGGTSRRDAVAGALAFDSDYAHPYTVQWAQSLNDGDGAWIIWLPPGHLFIDGKEVDITAAQSGGTGGMTAAGGDYPAGWYVLDLGDDYTEGDDFTLYLDVGASSPAFGIDATSMMTPVRICKVTDATKAVAGIVESALVFAAGGLLHPYEIQWAPSQNSGDGAWVIWLPPGCRRVSGTDKVPSSMTAASGLPSGWYLLGLTISSSGTTTVYLTVYPSQQSGQSTLNYFQFSTGSSSSGADYPIARIDGATKKVVQLQTTSIVTGTTMDELGVRHSMDFTNGVLTSAVSIEQDGTVIDTATAIVSIPTGGGGGGGSSITLTPGSGILINDSNQVQSGTSFTIKAVYV